ncbi:MAG: ATP-binding cassette domain-containing protein [Bdellovibrionota bacterium]|nr:MAG: ATP-binding cassette domain-containing protein [Bdellovibrionota bacterium]
MGTESFTTEEKEGGVRGSIPLLWRYARSLPRFQLLLFLAVLCSLLGTIGFNIFVWASGKYAECKPMLPCTAQVTSLDWEVELTIFGIAALALIVVSVRVVGWIFCEVGGQWCALTLHRTLVHAVGTTRTTFFDEFPSGKLINRLVRDFDNLRVMAPIRIGDTLNALIELVVIAAVVYLAHPFAALAVLPTLAMFMYIQMNVAPMMQRCLTLRSVRLGEVLHRETDVIEGIRTFLLYGQQNALFSRLQKAVRGFIEMHVLRFEVEAWGRFWGQFAAALYGFVALLFVAWAVRSGGLSMVLGAVVVTAVFRLGATFGWLAWSSGMMFESAAHIRRVFEYVDLPHEKDEEGIKKDEKSLQQPRGDLEFRDFTMSYRKDTPVILDSLTLTIAQGAKVGLVGRTGAGKTSILQALFRMVYVHGGDIRVGGVSIYSLPVEQSRELFGVVPQDPYLFEGTIRSNLDRYGDYTDEQVAAALQAVQLPFAMTEPIHEGGRNLSLGERQLVCLARLLLSKRPFVIMDEPTSGVDSITDAIMQRVLRTALHDRTVITIAHRIETLARVDRIIELQAGKVLRDGRPREVLQKLTADAIQ